MVRVERIGNYVGDAWLERQGRDGVWLNLGDQVLKSIRGDVATVENATSSGRNPNAFAEGGAAGRLTFGELFLPPHTRGRLLAPPARRDSSDR